MLERAEVDELVTALPETERHPIVLAYFGGHTYRDIARVLGVPEGTIKSRIRSGLKRLRAERLRQLTPPEAQPHGSPVSVQQPSSDRARSFESPDVNAPQSIRRMRSTTPMVVLSVIFIAAGGFIHLTEWLDVYRHVPASAPGAAVVRAGFPLNAAASLALVVALVLLVRRRSRLIQPAILTALAFQAASLATLIATRVDSVFGWSEPTWTPAAEQTRAVEIAAIASLVALAAIHRSSSCSDNVEHRSVPPTSNTSRPADLAISR